MIRWTARRNGRWVFGGDWWRRPLNGTGDELCRDDPLWFLLHLLRCVDTGESIRLNISWAWTIGNFEIEPGKEQSPSSLTWIETFCIPEVLQVLMVSKNQGAYYRKFLILGLNLRYDMLN